jgi:hypothetical protein
MVLLFHYFSSRVPATIKTCITLWMLRVKRFSSLQKSVSRVISHRGSVTYTLRSSFKLVDTKILLQRRKKVDNYTVGRKNLQGSLVMKF